LTTEDVKKDLRNISDLFEHAEPKKEPGRAVQLLLQSFDLLLHRLDHLDIDALAVLYLYSLFANIVPAGMRGIVKRLSDGELNVEQAKQELAILRSEYESLIAKL
jgi:hypothetical protein